MEPHAMESLGVVQENTASHEAAVFECVVRLLNGVLSAESAESAFGLNVPTEAAAGEACQDAPRLLVQVDPERESLFGYVLAPGHRRPSPDDSQLRLQIQLFCAKAWRETSEALLGPDFEQRSVVGISTPSLEEVDGIQELYPSEGAVWPGETQTWYLECESKGDLQQIMAQLQISGCIMQRLSDRYLLMDLLGVGSSAQVFLAMDLWTDEAVAVKLMTRTHQEQDISSLREAAIVRSVRGNQWIPQFHGIYETNEPSHGQPAWAIVTDFVGGGELFDLVRMHGPLPEERTKDIVHQLLRSIEFLSERGIVHRDIKTENVILTGQEDEIRLVDFGLASHERDTDRMTMRCGSPGFIAPEVLRGETYGCLADCFSVGVLMYILLSGQGPFRGGTVEETLLRNLKCRVSLSNLAHISREGQDLVLKLLTRRAETRLSATQALQHEWLKSSVASFAEDRLSFAPSNPQPPDNPQMVSSEAPTLTTVQQQLPGQAASAPMQGQPGAAAESMPNCPDFRSTYPEMGSMQRWENVQSGSPSNFTPFNGQDNPPPSLSSTFVSDRGRRKFGAASSGLSMRTSRSDFRRPSWERAAHGVSNREPLPEPSPGPVSTRPSFGLTTDLDPQARERFQGAGGAAERDSFQGKWKTGKTLAPSYQKVAPSYQKVRIWKVNRISAISGSRGPSPGER
eukprot:gnl/TRDRNA2_/TRDRNA2_177916_c1_seq2.p1 gnl/TRDRNA2_/TRDRNA2_177916_c1~~gnl/TRDRNA2_/TRDRNA2_177916_c1_seq2.p1  ORF type:complete len:701 (-),score=97.58 gnl/TRDRNA2_/TRDRNA2_177916_c1_seq2:167-2215(-)